MCVEFKYFGTLIFFDRGIVSQMYCLQQYFLVISCMKRPLITMISSRVGILFYKEYMFYLQNLFWLWSDRVVYESSWFDTAGFTVWLSWS